MPSMILKLTRKFIRSSFPLKKSSFIVDSMRARDVCDAGERNV